MKINVKGAIVSNDDKPIYDLFNMESTSPNAITSVVEEANGEDLEVVINSGGGCLMSGADMYSTLKGYEGNVTVKISGVAGSAASIVAMAADQVKMSPVASLFIHNVQLQNAGDHNSMQYAADTLKVLNKTVANAYREKTGMSQDELLDLMNNDTWMDCEAAKERGFIDEILFQEEKAVASVEGMIPQKVINGVRNTLMKQKLRNEEETKEEKQEETFTSEQKQAIRNIVKDEIKKQIEKDEPEEKPDNSVVVNGVKYVAESKINKHKRWL